MRPAPLAAIYSALAVLVTWPLLLYLPDRIPNDHGDPLLNVWILNWIARTVPLTDTWWNAPQFFPASGALAFSEHLIGMAPLTTPIILVTGNAVLAYNVVFLLAFAASALATHVLVQTLTGRHDAALIAAVAWGVAPYRIDHTAHIQVIAAWWMPMALLGLHLYLRDRQLRWLWLFAVAWVLQGLSNGYYLVFLSVLVALWLAWFVPGRVEWKDVRRLAVAGTSALLVVAPFLHGYWRTHRFHVLSRPLDAIVSFSADVAGLLTAPANLLLWGWLQAFPRPEGAIFPGAVIVAIATAGCVVCSRRPPMGRGRRGLVGVFGVLAAAAAMAAVALRVNGPFSVALGGRTLVSVSTLSKPLTVAVVFAVLALVLHPRLLDAWRRRSPLAFYALATLVITTFAFGPEPTLLGEPAVYRLPAPYAILMELPGLDGLRVPARFWMIASLCLAVAGGLAFARLSRPRFPLALALAALIVLEGWPVSLPLLPLPAPRPAHVDAVARLHLPTTLDSSVLYQAMRANRTLINGHSGNVPRHYILLERLLAARDPDVLTTLRRAGPIEVVIERPHDPDGLWAEFVTQQPGAVRRAHLPDYSVFLLPAIAGAPYTAPEEPVVPIAAFAASANPHLAGALTDGHVETRWDTGAPQASGQWLRADFEDDVDLTAVTLEIGAALSDFPRQLEVLTSRNGRDWVVAWRGSTSPQALLGALAAPGSVPLHLPFSASGVRSVLLRLTADADDWWSVTEFRAYGRSSASTAGRPPPAAP